MALLNINREELPQADSFDLIPEGWYVAKAKSVELKATKDGSGQYLAICWTLENNRTVFGNINLKNRNDVAEKIGLQQLSQLMGAVGIAKLKDSDQLVGARCSIKVGIGKKQEGYEQRNEVKAFKAIEGSEAPIPFPIEKKPDPASAPWGIV